MKSTEEIRRLEQLAKQTPKNIDVWIALGNSLMDTSRFSEAVEAYKQALTLDPKNVDVLADMGTCYRGLWKPEKAIEKSIGSQSK